MFHQCEYKPVEGVRALECECGKIFRIRRCLETSDYLPITKDKCFFCRPVQIKEREYIDTSYELRIPSYAKIFRCECCGHTSEKHFYNRTPIWEKVQKSKILAEQCSKCDNVCIEDLRKIVKIPDDVIRRMCKQLKIKVND
jgi:hypothetical protein